MSKSKGNIIPLKDLIKKIGSDLVRINIISSAENLDDADWRDENIPSYLSRINFITKLVKKLKKASREETKKIDILLISNVQKYIKEATQAYEELRFRTATQILLFKFTNELKEYMERCGGMKKCNRKVLREALENLIKLLTPLLPHLTEEWWSLLENHGFICVAKWPEFEENKFDQEIEVLEENFKKMLEDISQVLKLVGKKDKAYFYFSTEKELEFFSELRKYVKKKFGFKKIFAYLSSDEKRYDPQDKASKAKFGKPGIYLE